LAAVVAASSVLWLVPGDLGRALAWSAASLIFVATAIDFVMLPPRRRVDARRAIPETLGLGDRHDAVLEIESRWQWPFKATIAHEMPSTLIVDVLPSIELSANGAVAVPMAFTPMRRGRIQVGDVALRA